MTKTLDTIHHTAIQVADIAESVSWYTSHFSCEVEYQDDNWAMLKFANTSIALVMPGMHPFHFAVVTDDIEAYGKPVPHRDGTASVYIEDIDGNHVEMLNLLEDEP